LCFLGKTRRRLAGLPQCIGSEKWDILGLLYEELEENETIPPAATQRPAATIEQRSSDLELVRSVLAEDRKAIDVFVERMRCIPRILQAKNGRFGHSLDAQDLDDLSQEVFSKVWSKLGTYRGDAALETWAYPFCVYALMNALRKAKRRPHELAEPSETPAPRDPSLSLEEERDLYRALDELDEGESRVVALKHFRDATFDAIGDRLEISPNTAKTRYYRALSRLRSLLSRSRRPEDPE